MPTVIEHNLTRDEARELLTLAQFSSDEERQWLEHIAELEPSDQRPFGCRVLYDEELDCMFIYDALGFLTTIHTEESLWQFVKQETLSYGHSIFRAQVREKHGKEVQHKIRTLTSAERKELVEKMVAQKKREQEEAMARLSSSIFEGLD